MRLSKFAIGAAAGLVVSLAGAAASAQNVPVPTGTPGATGGQVQVFQVPPAPAPAAAPQGPQGGALRAGDGNSFSLGTGRGGGPSAVRGNKNSAYVVSGQNVPELHTVRRGDTLWDISRKYYKNPYHWPRIWSHNRQVQNPHWLYPGDHVRLRSSRVRNSGMGSRLNLNNRMVPPDTVFIQNQGFVRDNRIPTWGSIIGSPDDQMLLSANDEVYIKLKKDQKVRVGQALTIFEPKDVKNASGEDFVWIRGVVRVNRFNPKTGMVRGLIVESHRTIERGVLVGPQQKGVLEVKPTRNKQTVRARIVGALYPFEFYGQNQVVFIDKGDKDGIKLGNRFFAVTRGDNWRLGLRNAGNMADRRAVTEDDRSARVDDTPDTDEPKLYPAETYAELIVTRVREKTATCLIINSRHEIARGALVIARKGY